MRVPAPACGTSSAFPPIIARERISQKWRFQRHEFQRLHSTGRNYTLTNMPRLKAPQRREQLIDVATKLFAGFGYDATTTAAIAKAAGVTEPILYRHFKSKQDLFVAIVRAVSDQTIANWREEIAPIEDPAERIKRVCVGMPEHFKKLEDQYHVLHG